MARGILRGLRFTIRGDSDTTAAKDDVEGFALSAEAALAKVAAAAVAAQQAIEAIGQSARAQADAIRALEVAAGGGTESTQQLLADVVTVTGFDEGQVAQAIQAAGARASVAEVAAFADLASAGADPNRLRRIAEQSATTGAARIDLFELLRAGAAGAGVDVGEFTSEFADQQTTFRNLGLDVPAQIALQADVFRSGTPSEAQTLLEQVVDRSARAGLDPAASARALFDRVRTGSRAEGLEALEAFGGANLLDPIRSGRLGLDAEALALEIPEGLQRPGRVTLSPSERIEAAARGIDIDPRSGFFDRLTSAAYGLPGVNQAAGQFGDAFAARPDIAEGDSRLAGTVIVVNVAGSVITAAELNELIAGTASADPRTTNTRFGP